MARRGKTRKWHYAVLAVGLILISAVLFTVVYYRLDPALLAELSFYQNLANPYVRIVRVEEGLRKEEVVEALARKLDWDAQAKANFLNAEFALNIESGEGRYFPKTYLISKEADPVGV